MVTIRSSSQSAAIVVSLASTLSSLLKAREKYLFCKMRNRFDQLRVDSVLVANFTRFVLMLTLSQHRVLHWCGQTTHYVLSMYILTSLVFFQSKSLVHTHELVTGQLLRGIEIRALEQKIQVQVLEYPEKFRFVSHDKMTLIASQSQVNHKLSCVNGYTRVSVQVYKLEPKAYDHQVQQLVMHKHFELALQVAVSEMSVLCVNDIELTGADQRI